MLFGILFTLYLINCFFLILIILIQKGKSSMGIGAIGGQSQMLFGGGGGQDIFQKITWICGTFFMIGSLVLSIMKSSESKKLHYVRTKAPITQSQPLTK